MVSDPIRGVSNAAMVKLHLVTQGFSNFSAPVLVGLKSPLRIFLECIPSHVPTS